VKQPEQQNAPVVVLETWHLRPELSDRAIELMQTMDDLVGPAAHADAGWCGHASFWQSHADPATVHMVYPWRTVAEHRTLAAAEQSLLADFHRAHCTRAREISYFTELPVDVDHDDH
jgi:3-oxoacyl-[acyl-carrier protein] reductase